MSMCVSTAQARTKHITSGAQHFSCKFSHKVALVVLNLWVCGIFGINGDPAMFLSKRSLHDPVQVHNRLSCGDPGEILSERSLQLAWGARRCHVEYQDLVRSTPAATILWDSLKGPGMEILLKVFYNSLREGLVEILVKCCQRPLPDLLQVLVRSSWRGPRAILSVSLHDLAQVLVRRLWKSCWNHPQKILKILKILCAGACMKVLLGCSQEILVWRSCELLCIDLHRRSCCCSCDHV